MAGRKEPTDYEKQWPALRVEWAREKIAEWEQRLRDDSLPILERRKLQQDAENMKRALADWERRI